MAPPAKAASPSRNDDTHRGETNPATLLEDLSIEEEILPQWSADKDDEALLEEASERGTSQQEEPNPKDSGNASGAKRLHTDPSGQSKDRENTKRRRDEARMYPVYFTPRDPKL